VQTSPLRYLASGAAVGAAAAALVVGLSGPAGSESGSAAAGATADVVGTVGKPVKPLKRNVAKPLRKKARPRPPMAAEPARPNDPLWGDSWSLSKVRAPAAWRLTSGAAETVVAVLDTGVDRTHADLQGAFVEGWDAVNEDADPSDDHGHGTLVAGVIAARSNNGIGGVGACPRCSVMPVKVIAANGSGNSADIAEGITWAADHGARVINMSFVMSGRDDGVAQAIQYARSKGILVVAAAGNSGSADATFPANEPGVVGVTSTDPADTRYDWASFGSWVTLAAPGCSKSTQAGGGYADFCGTSSSAAFASGIAALARSADPQASADQVVAALSANAVRVGDFVAAGRVDAAATTNVLSVKLSSSVAPAPADTRPDHPEPRPDPL
jgi:subtilisin family serine protease